jgi:hypothetical protein
MIVARLSDAWGVDCSEDGCVVWCEVAVEDGPAAVVERNVTAGYVHELALQLATGGERLSGPGTSAG